MQMLIIPKKKKNIENEPKSGIATRSMKKKTDKDIDRESDQDNKLPAEDCIHQNKKQRGYRSPSIWASLNEKLSKLQNVPKNIYIPSNNDSIEAEENSGPLSLMYNNQQVYNWHAEPRFVPITIKKENEDEETFYTPASYAEHLIVGKKHQEKQIFVLGTLAISLKNKDTEKMKQVIVRSLANVLHFIKIKFTVPDKSSKAIKFNQARLQIETQYKFVRLFLNAVPNHPIWDRSLELDNEHRNKYDKKPFHGFKKEAHCSCLCSLFNKEWRRNNDIEDNFFQDSSHICDKQLMTYQRLVDHLREFSPKCFLHRALHCYLFYSYDGEKDIQHVSNEGRFISNINRYANITLTRYVFFIHILFSIGKTKSKPKTISLVVNQLTV